MLILETASQEACRTDRPILSKKVLEAGLTLAVACRIGSCRESVSVGIVGAGLVGQEVLRQLRVLDTERAGLGPLLTTSPCNRNLGGEMCRQPEHTRN